MEKPTVRESIGTVDLSSRLDAYYEAQSKVWNRDNTYLFELLK